METRSHAWTRRRSWRPLGWLVASWLEVDRQMMKWTLWTDNRTHVFGIFPSPRLPDPDRSQRTRLTGSFLCWILLEPWRKIKRFWLQMQLPFLFTVVVHHVPAVAGPQTGSGTALFSTVHGDVLQSMWVSSVATSDLPDRGHRSDRRWWCNHKRLWWKASCLRNALCNFLCVFSVLGQCCTFCVCIRGRELVDVLRPNTSFAAEGSSNQSN